MRDVREFIENNQNDWWSYQSETAQFVKEVKAILEKKG